MESKTTFFAFGFRKNKNQKKNLKKILKMKDKIENYRKNVKKTQEKIFDLIQFKENYFAENPRLESLRKTKVKPKERDKKGQRKWEYEGGDKRR